MANVNPVHSMPQQPIVILGCGIAGLTLRRCLAQKGIPSIIYERVTSKSSRHNYGITLHEWAYKPLLHLLNQDVHSLRRRTAVDSLYHEGTGKIDEPEFPGSFRANRSKLELLLREGQEVNWEHDLHEIQTLPNGEPWTCLTFQNQLQISSSIVVDTLGVHSQLRKSLLPQYEPQVLPYVVFSGRRHVKRDEFSKRYAPFLDDVNIRRWKPAENKTVLLQIQVNNHLSSGDVEMAYVYSRTARSMQDQQPDPLHNPSRSAAGAKEIPEAFYHELEQLCTNSELPELFSTTFDPSQIRQDRVLHWLMRTLLVSPTHLRNLLSNNGVVMVGDSAHALPILGGDGANHAMKDACELAELIAASSIRADPALSSHWALDRAAIAQFYDECAHRWENAVMDSERKIASMHHD
jgi:tyrosinase